MEKGEWLRGMGEGNASCGLFQDVAKEMTFPRRFRDNVALAFKLV